jgi:hypothetical protein
MIAIKLPRITIPIRNQIHPVAPFSAAKYIGIGGISIRSKAVKCSLNFFSLRFCIKLSI